MWQDIRHIRPIGRLDSDAAPRLEAEILDLIAGGARRILFDCSDLTYMSSAGLRVVVIACKAVRSVDGRIVFCGVNSTIGASFDTTGFSSFLEIAHDAAAGRRLF